MLIGPWPSLLKDTSFRGPSNLFRAWFGLIRKDSLCLRTRKSDKRPRFSPNLGVLVLVLPLRFGRDSDLEWPGRAKEGQA